MLHVLSGIVILCLIHLSFCDLKWSRVAGPRGGLRIAKDDDLPRIGSDFDYLMLTRIYPTAVCRADDDAVPDSCEIPAETPSWSIHGLWPNYNNGSYPQFCDGVPKKFDEKLIEPIRVRLQALWPNLFPTKSVESFWKHEWEKHGTCGESDKRLNSEINYFQSTIDLNSLHDVATALKAGDITPRLQPYHKDDIQKALNTQLGKGHHVQFNCLKDKKSHMTLLGDVRMCVNRDFELVDCDVEGSSQPLTELLGQEGHLPSFLPCPEKIVYLPDIMVTEPPTSHLDSTRVRIYIDTFFNLRPSLARGDRVLYVTMVLLVLVFLFILRERRQIHRERAFSRFSNTPTV